MTHNSNKAIRIHVDDEDKGGAVLSTPGGNQKVIFINESGLYSLILSSKLPQAKAFKRWATSEVLPSIRNASRLTGIAPDEPVGILSPRRYSHSEMKINLDLFCISPT